MSRNEIVLGGFGGQGIILAGFITGKAASLYDKKNATLTQDYGPEARGGSCRAQVVISEDETSYPYVESPSVVAVMSQEAYAKSTRDLGQDALVLIDEDLVKPEKSMKARLLAVPATRTAQELGRTAVANIVMLGFLAAVTDIISAEAMKKSILDSVPKGTEELNLKAFERGYSYGMEKLKASKREGRK